MTRIAQIAAAVIIIGFLLWFIWTLGERGFAPEPDDDPEPVEHIHPAATLVPLPTTSTTVTSTTMPVARNAPTRHVAALSVAPVGELQDLIRVGFAHFGATVAEEAVRVAGCESTGDETGQHLDPNRTGDAGEVGLFQIHPKYHTDRAAKFGWTMADLYDPAKNITVAADIYAEKGRWSPTWSCGYAA